jgi:hypothetical protein
LQEWARIFPEEFWQELARLEEVHYSARSRPLRWGKYVMIFASDAVEKKLAKKSDSNGAYVSTEEIQAHIRRRVVTAMRRCEGIADFRKKFDRVFDKSLLQKSLLQTGLLRAEKGLGQVSLFSRA